jgi:hypothetical protein
MPLDQNTWLGGEKSCLSDTATPRGRYRLMIPDRVIFAGICGRAKTNFHSPISDHDSKPHETVRPNRMITTDGFERLRNGGRRSIRKVASFCESGTYRQSASNRIAVHHSEQLLRGVQARERIRNLCSKRLDNGIYAKASLT